jgi:acetyl-CoA carboxylase carboxyltransferase component
MVATLKSRGEDPSTGLGGTITKEREAEILGKIRAKFEESMSPYYAAARLWLDAIIDPLETRTWISMGIEAASQAPATREFNMGLLQT